MTFHETKAGQIPIRGIGEFEKLGVLVFITIQNTEGTLGCVLIKLKKVRGAIALPAPPVPPSLPMPLLTCPT